MTQHPDKLFREKLENLRLNAPENAWSRIESGLDKTLYKGLWLKIAAGLVLLAVAGVLIWNGTTNKKTTTLTSTTPEKTETETDVSVNKTIDEKPVEQTLALQDESKKETHKARNIGASIKSAVNERNAVITETVSKIHQEEISVSHESLIAEVTIPEISEAITETTGVYLVYTVEEVNQKYLRNLPEDDATQETKKSSRMQMLMGVAMNLKNGDSGLGDLRQMKDEIFALNFLDEKKPSKKN